MKNPRTLNPAAIKSLLAQHPLSKTSPPPDSLFWRMWNACLPIAKQALQTDFIQGINKATLDPVTYGGFNVSDAYYCFNGANAYQEAANKASDEILQAFLMKKHNSYEDYNKTFPTIWHIKDANGVIPNEVIKRYSDFELDVVNNNESIYCLIVMIPCEYLWAWLGAQLAPPQKGNLYAPWITGNNDPDGAYLMGNFLNEYQKQYPLDEQKALSIFKQAMEYEFQNFSIATAPH